MNVLVLGSGGREHAIALECSKSPLCDKLFVAPGNGGTAEFAENISNLNAEDGAAVLEFCQQNDVEFVAIGPEAPLVAGVTDVLRDAGIAVFGPDKYAAQLEGSKVFAKEFMDANKIPNAKYQYFKAEKPALKYIDEIGAPCVVKADGLAAGKGVIVAEDIETAKDAVKSCFSGDFGDAGKSVLIEECLIGFECSMFAFLSDGKAFCMAPSQDHKRAYDGDAGPNTGGMGAYSPVPAVTSEAQAKMEKYMQIAAAATAKAPFPQDYRGCLYGGFMITKEGPKVLEFNVRFGDPETQVVLPRLESDLLEIMLKVAKADVDQLDLKWKDDCGVTVVLASEGYPGSYEKGKVILGVKEADSLDGVTVYHAGTALNKDGELITSGGRVFAVTALEEDFEDAIQRAYDACDKIHFEGKQYRKDIAQRALTC